MADKNLGDLIFDLALDDSKFQAAITRSVDTIKKFNTTIAGLGSASVGGGVEGIVTKQDEVMSKISDYFAMMQKRQETLDAAAASKIENAKQKAADKAKKIADDEAAAVIAAEQKKLAEIEKNAKKAADAKIREEKRAEAERRRSTASAEVQGIRVLSALESAAGGLATALTSAFTAVFASITAIGTAITVIGASFENTINKVGVISEASASQIAGLTDAAREFGRTSAFSAQEAADAMLNFAQAGYTVEQNIAATGSAIKLAAASGGDLSLATSIMSDAISQFSLSTNEAANLADLFTFALNGSKLGMNDLGVSMRYAGTVGAGFGMTVQQTTAALMMFSNLGLKGSKAGTVFRLAMTKAADATAEAKRILDAHKISLDEINPALNDFGQILDVVARNNITTSEAMEIFGLQAGASVVQLARQQEAMRASGKDFDGLVRSMEQATRDGLAGQTAAAMQATVVGQFKRILAALRDLALGIYAAYAEPLKGLLTETLAIVNSVVGVFDSVGLNIEQGIGVALQNLTAYLRENRVAIAGMIVNAIEQFNRFGTELIRLTPVFMGLVDVAMNFGSAVLTIGDALAAILPGVTTAGQALADLFIVSSIVAFVAGIYKAGVALGVFRAEIAATQLSLTSLTGGLYALLAVGGLIIGWLTTYKSSNDAATRSVENLAAAEQHRRLINDEKYAKQLERIGGALEATKNSARDQLRTGKDLSASRKAELQDIMRLTKEQALAEIQAGRLVQVNGQLLSTEQVLAQSTKTSAGQQSVLTQIYRDRTRALADATDRLGNLERAYADAGAASKKQQESIIPGAATKESVKQRVAMGAGADILSYEELGLAIKDAKKEVESLKAQQQAFDDQMLLANGTVKKASFGMSEFEAATKAAKTATREMTAEVNKETDALQRLIDEAQKRYDEVIRGLKEVSTSEAELQADRIAAQIEADNAIYDAAAIAAAALHDATVDWEQRKQESAAKIRATYGIKSLNEARALAKKAQDDLFAATASEAEIRKAARKKEEDDLNAQFDAQVVLNEGQGVLLKGIEEQRTAAIAAIRARHNAEDLAREKKHGDDLVAVALGVSDELAALAQKGVAGLLGGGPIFGGMFASMGMARTDAQTQAQTAINEILDKGVKDYRDANKDKGISDQDAAAYRVQLEKDSEGQIAQIQDVARKQGTKDAHQQMMTIFANSKVLGAAYQILWNKIFKLNDKAARGLDYFVVGLSKGIKGIASGFQGVMKVVEQISGFSLNVLGIIQDAIGFVQSEQKAAIEDASARAKAAGFDPAEAERRAAAATNPADMATKFVENLVGGAVRITQMFVAVVGPVISELAAQLPSLFTAVADAIPQIVTAFAQNIGPLVAAIVEGVPKVALALIDAIPAIATALIEAILYDLLPALPEIAWNLVTAIWTALWETLKAAGGAIGNWFAGLFGGDAEGSPAAYSGMDYVPSTMRATLHQGEAVIPADRNARRLRGATAPAPAGADQNYGGRGGMGGFGPLEVSVIAEGRLLEAVQLRAEDMGRATGMAKRIRKAAGTKVGFSRGDYNPWSR